MTEEHKSEGGAVATLPDVDKMLEERKLEFEAQLDELRPAVDAYRRIEGILSNWDRVTDGRRTRRGTSSTNRAERGSRPQEFLKLVEERPGITVTEALDSMTGVNKNYLYRIARELVEEGKLRKEDHGYHPVA